MITQHFILHMVPDTVRPKIYLSQRSTGLEKLQFTLVGTNGAYYSIPSGTSVTIVGSKPDKKSFSYACTYSGSTVYVDVVDQMTAVAGIVNAELRFENSQGATLPSQNMEIIVERSPLDGSVCSINDFKSVDEEIISVHQDAMKAKQYSEQTQATAEQALTDITDTKDSAQNAINLTKTEAISAVELSEATVLQEFEDTKSYIEQYGTSGVVIEYDATTGNFKITSVTN